MTTSTRPAPGHVSMPPSSQDQGRALQFRRPALTPGDAKDAMPGVQVPRRPMANRIRAEPIDRHGKDLRPYLAADQQ